MKIPIFFWECKGKGEGYILQIVGKENYRLWTSGQGALSSALRATRKQGKIKVLA
jgi:hypothetical protein